LAVIYAWTRESEQACNQLALGIANLSNLSYGQLRLSPFWDSLRGDPRFEKIVAVPSAKMAARRGVFVRCVCWVFSIGRWGRPRGDW